MTCDKDTTGSTAGTWDREATTYDATREIDPVYSSCIRQVTNAVPKGTTVCLDAGCGTGLSTIPLSAKCNVVIAVDFSFKSLEMLNKKALRNVVPVQGELTALPFKKSVFDACVCANTLQHFRSSGPQKRAVEELLRVTKEKGVVSVSVHHFSRNKRKAGWIKEGKPGQPGIDYIFRFCRNDLMRILPASVVKGVGYYGFLNVPFFGSRQQDLLARVLGRFAGLFGFGHMLIAVASKENLTKTV